MIPAQIIAAKRDGLALSDEQIAWFVGQFTHERLTDHQMSALAMAIYLRGMDARETAALTMAMLHSGTVLQWPSDAPPRVDKHASGGLGDKTSLVLAPLLAACGLWVPMISGRGLGITGGTLDKLEAIDGFRTNLALDEIRRTVAEVGCVITGATTELAPADRRLYRLRDVTATVGSQPLIVGSIMSKKLAEGLSALVLDVKFGSGTFMRSIDDARALALAMVDVGRRAGVATSALLTDMNQPLGHAVGNAVEVDEALASLAGGGPPDLRELVLALGAELLVAAGNAADSDTARRELTRHLDAGRALEKFRQMVAAQGGDLDAPRPLAPRSAVLADRGGYVAEIDGQKLGTAVVELGGGRKQLDDAIDPRVGLFVQARLGERVERGQPLVEILAEADAADRVRPLVAGAVLITDEPPPSSPLIAERIA